MYTHVFSYFLQCTLSIISVCGRGGFRKISLTSILVEFASPYSNTCIPQHLCLTVPLPPTQSYSRPPPRPPTLRLPVRATLHRRLLIKLKTCMTNEYIHVCIVKITGKVLRARVWRKRDYKHYFLFCTLSIVFVPFIL